MVQRKYDDSEDSADAFFLVHREMKLNAILFSFFSTQSISFSHEMGDEVGLSSQNKSTCPSNVCVNHLKYPFSCTDGELGRQR